MKKYITIILLFTICVLQAQNVKRPLKNIESGDYEKAKELLEKNLEENPEHVTSHFGMAIVLSDEKSPFFNMVDSWDHIVQIKDKTGGISQDEQEVLAEFFYARETRKSSRPALKKLEMAVEELENRLIQYIREENDLEAIYAVLERYPNYKHYDNVVHIRNQFEFQKYETMNTVAGYTEFINKFPDAAQINKAIKLRDKMAFKEAKDANTEEAYNKYIEQFPESHMLLQVIKLRNEAAYNKAKSLNTLQAYENFVTKYPDALQILDAKMQLYTLLLNETKRLKTIEAYNKFIRLYPESEHYSEIFDMKSSELGRKFSQKLPFNSSELVWAKAFDNNGNHDVAQAVAVTKDGGYVIVGTTKDATSKYSDIWIVKLNATGKIEWDKTIGEKFTDRVQNVLITSDNQIIVVAETQSESDKPFSAWLFMLSETGSKKWSRNIGIVNVIASAISSNDQIVLSVLDTDNCHLKILDNNARQLKERIYTQKGGFKDIMFTQSGDILLAGQTWVTLTDPQLYIKYEDTLMHTQTSISAYVNGDVITCVGIGSNGIEVCSLNSANNEKVSKLIASNDTKLIDDVFLTANTSVISIRNTHGGGKIAKYDGGDALKEKSLPEKSYIVAIIENQSKISYLINRDRDFYLVTLSGVGF